MRKFLLTFGVVAVPFVAQAPTVFTPEQQVTIIDDSVSRGTIVVEESVPQPPLQLNTTVKQELDSYHVVKEWGRYKVINVDNVLEVPEFFKRKSEAVEFAKTMNGIQLISN